MYYVVYSLNVCTNEKTYNETNFGTKCRYSRESAMQEVRISNESILLNTRWGFEPIRDEVQP